MTGQQPWAVGIENVRTGKFNIHSRYEDEEKAREVAGWEGTERAGVEVRHLPVPPEPFQVNRGEAAVIMRRMEALKNAIDAGDTENVKFVYDQVLRALTKAFEGNDHA